jgi:tetratricopeptide (TPR) repeat protein
MKFIVEYSLEKDINVYLDALWQPKWVNYGKTRYEIAQKDFPIEFLDAVKNAQTREKAYDVVLKYFENTRSPKFQEGSAFVAKWFNKILNEDQNIIINRLEKIYNQKFPFKKINVYLGTFISNPYNYDEKWYIVGRSYNLWGLFGTSTHELNHFMFYFYYKEKLIKLGYERKAIEYLKEALAVLTSNNPSTENKEKIDVLPIQNFVYQNREKSVDEIIDLVLKNKLLENIK